MSGRPAEFSRCGASVPADIAPALCRILLIWAILIGLAAPTALASGFYGYGAAPGLEGDVRQGGVGSPVLTKQDGVYYVFTGGAGINIRRSNDTVAWAKVGTALPAGSLPAWAEAEFPEKDDNSLWAPDISYFNGKYHLYYSVSTLGSNHSAIGFATNTTLNPSEPDYQWVDHGGPIKVTQTSNNYNAIDPNIILDMQGDPWMVFGSYWTGIKMHKIDPATGRISAQNPTMYPLAKRTILNDGTKAVEAPFIVHRNGYYWLFVSFDRQPTDYKIMVGRSSSITGPYVDFDGTPMMEGGGTLVLKGYSDITAPGHNGVMLDDDGTDWLIHHYKDARYDGDRTLMMHELIWGPDGWPVVGEPHDRAALHPLSTPFTWGAFAHSVNFHDDTNTLEFLPGGAILRNNKSTDGIWHRVGNVLTMTWPNANAPGGAFVDTVTLADHGRWYVGRNQNGTVVRGVRTALLAGDFNWDGSVDAADYVLWKASFGSSGGGLAADADRDGVVELSDLNAWRRHFGQSIIFPGGAFAMVPEPASAQLLGVAMVLGAMAGPRTFVLPVRQLARIPRSRRSAGGIGAFDDSSLEAREAVSCGGTP